MRRIFKSAAMLTLPVTVLALAACGAATSDSIDPLTTINTTSTAKWSVDGHKTLTADQSDATDAAYGQCPQIVCLYATNTAQVFTGPNQLGPATYSLAQQASLFCYGTNIFPATLAAGGIEAQCNWPVGNTGARATTEVTYSPPAPMPNLDPVTMRTFELTNNPYDKNTPNGGSCNSPIYTGCNVTHVGTSQQNANWVFAINNFPVTVAITNNLSASNNDSPLALMGQPAAGQFILDPNGQSANSSSIDAASTGYFGMYGTVVGANAVSTQLESFSATYKVPANSTDIPGGSFVINAVLNPKTGQLDPSATCTFQPGSNAQSAFCNISLVGAPGGPQTITVDIHN